jgi:hypothetical protein
MRITMIGAGYVGLSQEPVSPISGITSPASTKMLAASLRSSAAKFRSSSRGLPIS